MRRSLTVHGHYCGRVVVQGQGPGPRYGHVMSLVGQRFLLSISGNDGALIRECECLKI